MATKKEDTKPAAKTADTETSSAAPVAPTFGGSPVTTEITGNQSKTREIDLSTAKITVPADSIKTATGDVDPFATPEPAADTSLIGRANKEGIGLIRVDGVDFRYVGLSPARDEDAKTAAGLVITTANSTFTPLGEVTFDQSVRVKDPASGEFYFPTNASGWGDVELNGSPLVPKAEA